MHNAAGAFIFAAGAAIGSAVTWYLLKTKYEKLAQEEIDSVKEVYSKREKPVEKKSGRYPWGGDPDISDEKQEEEKTVAEYAAELQKSGYTNYSDVDISNKKDDADRPYVIPPDEFGEIYDYNKISLTYHSDHILACDYDPVEDIDEVVGIESLNHFGEYEDDSVFVRNDRLKCDYEILLDQRKFSDILKNRSH